jgi:hypothetical protein
MKSLLQIILVTVAPALMFMIEPCYSAEVNDIQIIKGKCEEQSHIAEGKMGEDLTKRRSRFFCDSAVITFFDNKNQRLMIQFAESQSHNNTQLGFAGTMESVGQILVINRVYLGNKQVQVRKGYCKFFFKNKHMNSIMCAAPVDEEDHRTVPFVVFTASPGQKISLN